MPLGINAPTLALCLVAAATAPALAAPLTGAQAKHDLFPAKGAEVQVMKVPGFGAKEQEVLRTVGKSQKYYGAIAVSPGDGLVNEATVAAANFHQIVPAEKAALAACDKRKKAKAPCVVAAQNPAQGVSAGPRVAAFGRRDPGLRPEIPVCQRAEGACGVTVDGIVRAGPRGRGRQEGGRAMSRQGPARSACDGLRGRHRGMIAFTPPSQESVNLRTGQVAI